MKSLSITKVCLLTCALLLSNCSANDSAKIVIITDFGDIELQLYDRTPQHRENFIKLVKEGYYDGTLFHRVIKEFMIQGGDPNSKNAQPGERLGSGGPGYTVPAEFVPGYIHKRGALAAARQGDHINPFKASSGSQFYIVQGKTFNDQELDQVEVEIGQGNARWLYFQYVKEEEDTMQKVGQTVLPDSAQHRAHRRAAAWLQENPYRMNSEDREVYKTIGGTPRLDGEYTVFGEVIKGLDIIEKISKMETEDADRPIKDVKIKRMRIR
jgi:cyclophilin family peptidyl-prolyl cis-trans isomerase